jgi:hypothetical protein
MTNNYCTDRKDSLLEAALTGETSVSLQQHLSGCAGCREELEALRARRVRMDAALPLIAQAEPQPGFHARIMQAAAAQQKSGVMRAIGAWLASPQRRWVVAAPAVAALTIALALATRPPHNQFSADEIAAATRISNWQSPTAALLETPGQELLQGTPRLGETFFQIDLTTRVPTQEEKR